ncbi:hypothetical protein [Streptomyces alboflavus]|uniref:hypothetical protein n=1 Tax=Streptomyces alboflavus TaxID=67267 RepID=UPI000F65631F|nr:hypothetical protein [Streptomyces alboflavus]
MRELSPGRVVRGAVEDGAGGWANSYPHKVPVDDAAVYPGPVAMYLASVRGRRARRWFLYRFVVLDLDVSRGGVQAVRQQARELAQVAAAHGIRAVPVSSGPGGGIHLWLGCPQGAREELVARIAAAAQALYPVVDTSPLTNGHSGAVRPPGALHRNGGRSYLTTHTVEEAVQILKAGAPPQAFEALAATLEGRAAAPALHGPRQLRRTPVTVRAGGRHVPPSVARRGPVVRPVTDDQHERPRLDAPWRPLGAKALKLAQRRPPDTPGAHQGAVHAVLRSLALAGWDAAQAQRFAEDDAAAPALEWLRTASTATGRRALGDVEAEARFVRAWWLAVQDAARMPRRPSDTGTDAPLTAGGAAATDLLARLQAADPEHWRRPSGPADLAVLRSLAWLMATTGETEVSADVRRLAVLSGYTKSTAALALHRLLMDGWIEEAKEADMEAGRARRIRLADAHQCTGDAHHLCAHYTPASPKTPGHSGSDRSGTPPPPGGGVGFLSRLADVISAQQSGLWHELGHHCGRTLAALETAPHASHEDLRAHTGYTPATHARHLEALAACGVLHLRTTARGLQAVRTGRSLYAAAADCGTATRPAELAMTACVDVEVGRWWRRELAWCRSTRAEKRAQGPRASAWQTVIPGTDPYARAYPRHDGAANHALAWAIEASRIGAADLAAEACELARTGRVIDPAHLTRRHTAHLGLAA